MKIIISENMRLLDGMHEGLLILNKADESIMFCNKPAQKLLQDTMNFHQEKKVGGEQRDRTTAEIEKELLNKGVFFPI